MICYRCGNELSDKDFCTSCGADVKLYKKIMYISNRFYNDGLDAESTDGYTIYGLEKGQTDDEGKAANYAYNTEAFHLKGDATSENDQKVNSYINNLYLNDPNSRMFWPIWRTFCQGTLLVNDYGYGE